MRNGRLRKDKKREGVRKRDQEKGEKKSQEGRKKMEEVIQEKETKK